ncbi:RDD family protein [Amycolatopsis sp. PS_44_ISF1]|uniref:RDD family protein n=1 Tax=Amycolatopsis sp. PS_44_ISF1 TaxID=2974917 RepID=UPI0028DE86E0|nr:RDD family protein [Amycolatopsis sp. PS_44_ISF1]MDT8914628.1 RDD family protein [Amycolatopsis sp. PS_44_ISF1]
MTDPYGRPTGPPQGRPPTGGPYGSPGDFGRQPPSGGFPQPGEPGRPVTGGFGQPGYGQSPGGYGQPTAFGPPAPYGMPGSYGPPGGYANWGQRAGAYLIDIAPLIAGMIVALLVTIASTSAGTIVYLFALLGFLGWTVYNRWIAAGATGQSLGRRILGIRLIREDTGQPLGAGMAFVRDLAHVLDSAICYLGFLWPLWDDKSQTFSDKIIGTIVVPAEAAPVAAPYGPPGFGQLQQPFGGGFPPAGPQPGFGGWPQQPGGFAPPGQSGQPQPGGFGQPGQPFGRPQPDGSGASGFEQAEATRMITPGRPDGGASDPAERTQALKPGPAEPGWSEATQHLPPEQSGRN